MDYMRISNVEKRFGEDRNNGDPKYNKSLGSNGPFILVTNNFPTGARFWYPCFDEPDKKAVKYQLLFIFFSSLGNF